MNKNLLPLQKQNFKSDKAAARWILTHSDETPSANTIAEALGESYAPGGEPIFAGTHTIRASFPNIADEAVTFEYTNKAIYKAEGEPLDGYLFLAAYAIKRKTRFGLVLSFEGPDGRGYYRDAKGRVFGASDDFRIVGTVVSVIQDNGAVSARNTGLRFDPQTNEPDFRSYGTGIVREAKAA